MILTRRRVFLAAGAASLAPPAAGRAEAAAPHASGQRPLDFTVSAPGSIAQGRTAIITVDADVQVRGRFGNSEGDGAPLWFFPQGGDSRGLRACAGVPFDAALGPWHVRVQGGQDADLSGEAAIEVVDGGFAQQRVVFGAEQVVTRSQHSGVDLAAPGGTLIGAPAAGVVAFAGRWSIRRNVVVLDHGAGVHTLHAHALDLFVAPGQDVAAGQPLGRVGSTGLSTGPHLHWEVRVNGVAVEPLEWTQREDLSEFASA